MLSKKKKKPKCRTVSIVKSINRGVYKYIYVCVCIQTNEQKDMDYVLIYVFRLFLEKRKAKSKLLLEKEAEGLEDWSETNLSCYTPLYHLHFLSSSNITFKKTAY